MQLRTCIRTVAAKGEGLLSDKRSSTNATGADAKLTGRQTAHAAANGAF